MNYKQFDCLVRDFFVFKYSMLARNVIQGLTELKIIKQTIYQNKMDVK
jgi:hypothetical protein